MSIPKKVLEQGRKADEELEKLKKRQAGEDGSILGGNQETNTETPPTLSSVESEAPPGTPPEETPSGEGGFDWKAEAQALKADRDRIQQSLSVLQGKYNSEIGPLNETIRTLKERVAGLENNPTPSPEPSAPAATEIPGVTKEKLDEMREMYGDDLVNMMLSVAAGAKASAINELKPKIDEFQHSTEQSQIEELHKRIAEKHPNWQEIDASMIWGQFLDETDPATGLARRNVVMAAYNRRDPGPIIHALNEFTRRHGQTESTLETQVVPAGGGRPEIPQGGDKKTYKESEVHDFYTKATERLKQGRMTQEDFAIQDEVYTRAAVEGRIVR